MPLSISIALSWLVWTLASLFIVVLLLKFVVGPVTSGYYPLNSYYYLHKSMVTTIDYNIISLLARFYTILRRSRIYYPTLVRRSH